MISPGPRIVVMADLSAPLLQLSRSPSFCCRRILSGSSACGAFVPDDQWGWMHCPEEDSSW